MRIQAEANLSALIESTEDLIWSVDPRLRLITFNHAYKEYFERNFGGPVAPGMSVQELLPPELAVFWIPLYERALSGKTFSTEHTLVDGRMLEISFSPIVADGKTTGVSVFGKDITERKKAESELRNAEADLTALIESTRDLIWSVDLDYRLTTFNGALRQNIEETFGVRLEMGMRHYEVLPPERAALWPPFYARAISEGPFRVEYSLISPRILELAFSPILVDRKITGVSVFGKDITDRKRAELALLDSEARFRNFFEENGTVMFLVEPETGEFVYVNRAACEFYGYPREQLIGMFTRQISLSVPEEIARDRQRALRKECSCFYYSHRLANGEIREVELHSSPFEVNGRQMLYAIVNDITERKRAEQELRESSDFLNEAQRIGDLGCYVLDVSSGVWTSSRRLDEIFGIDETYEHSVAGWEALVHPADQAMMAAYFADEVIRDGRPFDKEYRIIRQTDQAERWVRGLGKLDFDELGKPLKMRGIISDVTAHKQWEMQLQDSEERYRTVFQTSPDGVLITRLSDGVIIDANQALLDAGRYERKDVIGRTTQELGIWVNDGDRQKLLDLLLQNGGYRNLEFSFKRKDGTTFWMRLSASLIEVEGCRCTLTFAQDISEAKAAAEALREGEERYRAAFQMNLDSIDICHLEDGKFVDVNDAFLHNLGFERDEVIGHTALELGIWENPADRQKMIELVRLNSFCRNIEVPYRTKDRLLRWGSLSVSTIEMNGVPSILSVTRDITDAKEAKDLLTAAAEALRLSEERYRTVFETSPDAVNISRLSDGVILDVNQSFLDSTGFTRNEVIGRTTQELGIWVNDSDRQRYFDSFTQNPICRDLEVLSRRKNGEIFWMRLSAALIEVEGIPCRLVFAKEITEVKEAAEALRRSEERYRSVFETTPDAVIITRVSDGVILDVNQSFLDSAGFARNEVIGRTTRDLGIWVNDSDRLRFIDAMTRNPTCRDVEVLSRRSNDEVFWMRLSAALIEVDGIPCRLVFAKEITEVKAAAEALRRSEERYRTAFQTSIDAININRMDDGKYLDCNQAFLDVMGYEREEVIGKTSLQLGIWTDPHDRTNMTELLRQNGSCRGLEVQFRKKSGEHFWGVMSASAMEVDGVLCILSITRDLSEVKAAQNEIRSLAYYDPLTGLPNRRLLLERLRQTLVADGRDGRLGALLFVELDNFKMLNETIGHLNGDLLLMEVGRRIVTCAREADIVSRFGGDEFALMIEDLSGIAEEAAAQAKAVAEKIQESIALPFQLEGRECITTASIGITVFGRDREGASELIQEADIAIYQATSAGRSTIRFFSPALQTAVNARATLEEDLRQAIKARQFLLYYQPQVTRGRLVGAEALIRWQHPKRGLVWPGEFISLAEETGLILPLGDWVLEAACAQLAAWAGLKQSAHLMLAVNISALQFRQPGFVATVLSALERSGANPKKLKLELTESMLVDNIEEVIAKMSELKEHGVSFALDDFGTGYSSLAYLKRLPLDQLKIDRAFVRDMLVDVASGAIAQTIISLGRAMGLSVMAEGVESEEQRGFLAGLGCHTFQGFLFNPPLTLEQFEALLLL